MNVHFSKLDNGDWICYDYLNTTGDLYVDPAKIELLTVMLPKAVSFGTHYWHDIPMKVEIGGFGYVDVIGRLRIETNGLIRNITLLTDHQEPIGTFNRFMLDLPQLPDFKEYIYLTSLEELADDDSKPGSIED